MNGYEISQEPISFEMLEQLYKDYKHSVPCGTHVGKPYFKALSYDKLSSHDLVYGVNRQIAKERLEMAIITGVLNKSLLWTDNEKWFWQSEQDKDFVILKKWIMPKRGDSHE